MSTGVKRKLFTFRLNLGPNWVALFCGLLFNHDDRVWLARGGAGKEVSLDLIDKFEMFAQTIMQCRSYFNKVWG